MNELKDKALQQLNKAIIDSTALQLVEAITIEPDTNDFVEGFKIYYADIDYQPIAGKYFYLSLLPKSAYKEIVLTPDELQKVLVWRYNDGQDPSLTKNEHIYKIVFKKKKPVAMTDL